MTVPDAHVRPNPIPGSCHAAHASQKAVPPLEKNVTYLAPQLVAQLAFEEWTDDRKLRQPVFLGLRYDKRPQDVTIPEAK